MKKAFLHYYVVMVFCLLALAIPTHAQVGNTVTVSAAGAPTGGCSVPNFYVNSSTGELYDCENGTWHLVGGGGGGGIGGSITATHITYASGANTAADVAGSAVDANGQIVLTASGETRTPITVRGAASQTAQIGQYQNALSATELETVAINAAGTGYTNMDVVTITGGGGTGATATIFGVDGMGAVTSIFLTTGGTGYTATTGAAVIGGTGMGLTLDTTRYAGPGLCEALVCIGGVGVGDSDSFGDPALIDIFTPGAGFNYALVFHNGASPAGAYTAIESDSDGGLFISQFDGNTGGASFEISSADGGTGISASDGVHGGTGFTLQTANRLMAIGRFQFNCSNLATCVTSSNFAAGAGWGSTATFVPSGGTDNNWRFDVTASGSGIAANPTFTFTYADGDFSSGASTVNYVCAQSGGNDTIADVTTTTRNQTNEVFTWHGTPTTGKEYEITCFGAASN